MTRLYFLAVCLMLAFACHTANAQRWITRNGTTHFFSSTKVQDIEAKNVKVVSAINPANDSIVVRMRMVDFQFKNKLMQEHFNEKYIESDKYPEAVFVGKIIAGNWQKEGQHEVSAKGLFKIHGQTKERELKGTISNDGKTLKLVSKFKMPLEDHNIEKPTIMFYKIADIIDTDCAFEYQLK